MQFSLILTYTNRLILQKKVHYDAFKKALRKDGLTSLTHPQRIRDAAIANLLVVTCNFPVFNPTPYILSLVHSRWLYRL